MRKLIGHLILAIMMCFPLSLAYAKAGCCSSHGGVAGCDSSGYLKCKDGTPSKTCKCDGSTAEKKASAKKSKTTTTATTTTAATTAPAATTKAKSTKGCCAKHGGVGACNKKTGYYDCKDGTASATCKCQ